MELLLPYFLRITPGLILIIVLFFLLPKKQILAKIFLLIIGFILMRDAMTPVGFWGFGNTESAFWLRFINDAGVLLVLGGLSLATAWLLLRVKEFRSLVRWGKVQSPQTYLVGVSVGILVALPFVLLSVSVPIEARGGVVAATLLPPLLFMALAGNFLEELIFRGFLQSYFEKHMAGIRAAILSGLFFATAHVFLASTVTDLGLPLLVFVAVEGLACALVYRRLGLISATLAHGIAIFVLASGLV